MRKLTLDTLDPSEPEELYFGIHAVAARLFPYDGTREREVARGLFMTLAVHGRISWDASLEDIAAVAASGPAGVVRHVRSVGDYVAAAHARVASAPPGRRDLLARQARAVGEATKSLPRPPGQPPVFDMPDLAEFARVLGPHAARRPVRPAAPMEGGQSLRKRLQTLLLRLRAQSRQ